MKFKDEDAFLKHARATERDFQELEAYGKQCLQQLKLWTDADEGKDDDEKEDWCGSEQHVDMINHFHDLAEAFGVDYEHTNMGEWGDTGWVFTLSDYLLKALDEEGIDATMNIAKYVRLTRLNSWKEINT
jgi:hypothetical protein